MKKVKFKRNGYETSMNDKLAAIFEKKGKVQIVGDQNPAKREEPPKKAEK